MATDHPHVRYDEATALVVVDMQYDFAHPEGNLYVSQVGTKQSQSSTDT